MATAPPASLAVFAPVATSAMVNPIYSPAASLTYPTRCICPRLTTLRAPFNYVARSRFVIAYAQQKVETATTTTPKLKGDALPAYSIATAAGVVVAICVFLISRAFRQKSRNDGGGSVSDLIRRGQLRSDRKSDSRPLKYEDPFNNPLVKIGSKNPIVRMCGKIFRLAPVTLTEEKVASHQNRRVQAYQWRRPVVFLNEGDPVPEGVDPDAVRWIPSNHPFATATDYIDEESAQKNVYQTRGVPSRLRAEHEALRKKMKEAAQKGQENESAPPALIWPDTDANRKREAVEDQDSSVTDKTRPRQA